MTNPVFVSPEVLIDGVLTPLDQLEAAGEAIFTGPEARHARKVLRLGEGANIDLVDGEGIRVNAKITLLPPGTSDAVGFTVVETSEVPLPKPQITLVQALVKGARADQAVETATEVGVDQIIPWVADRSISRWKPAKYEQGTNRWRRVALAASKQSRRARFPVIGEPVTTPNLLKMTEANVTRGVPVLVCHENATIPISEVLRNLEGTLEEAPEIVLIVGPEGGFSDKETEGLAAAGALQVSLGKQILRASTAGPAAIVATNTLLGRW